MARYRSSRILPVILILVIAIIVIVAIVSLVRIIFSSNTTSTPAQADTSRAALLDTTAGHSVQVTVRGPIVANEDFHSYTISIDPNSRTLTTYTGYTDTVVDTVTLPNNTASYEQFVYALDKAQLENGKQLTGDANDLRGRCAAGRLYDFQILDGSTIAKEVWTSTCTGSKGSLTGNVDQLLSLFQAQLPNAHTTIRKVDLQ
jgi:hypothetical protein